MIWLFVEVDIAGNRLTWTFIFTSSSLATMDDVNRSEPPATSISVPIVIEKRWKTYTPNKVNPADDLISRYGLKPLYHAFVRPPPTPNLAAEGKIAPMVQLQQSIAALLPDQSNIPAKSYLGRPSLLPLHEACPPHLLDASFIIRQFDNFESLREGMKLMPGRTDLNKKNKKRAGSPGEMSRSKKRKELEKRRAENAKFNLQTAPATLQHSGSRSPFYPGHQPRSSSGSRPGSPMAGSPAGSPAAASPGGDGTPRIKLKLKIGGSPMN